MYITRRPTRVVWPLAIAVSLASAPSLLAQDHDLDWQFTERFRLGTILGAETEAFHNLTPYSVTTDVAGNIFVLDRGNQRVLIFEPGGAFVRSVGREGSGPGELRNPVSIWSVDDSSFGLFDWAPHRVSIFTTEGDLVRDYSVPYSRGRFMYRDETHELFAVTEGFRPERLGHSPDSTIQRLNWIRFGDTVEIARMALVPPERVEFIEPCRFWIDITPLFEPSLVWDVAANRIAVNSAYDYRIDVLVFDGSRYTVSRPVAPTQVTRDDAIRAIGDPPYIPNPRGGDCGRFDADVILEKRGHYPFVQPVERIQIAPDGALWVKRRTVSGDDGATDVFDPAGEYVGTLPPDAPYPDAFTPDGDILVIERGEFDVEQVVVYAISQ